MSQINRRTFIQLTVLSGAALTAAGCRNETIVKSEATGQYGGYGNRGVPYLNQPDGLTDGVPQYFATACAMCSAGCGLFVRTMGGRAITVSGNPEHPVSGGKSCARGQASVQHLYNPDRLRFPAFGQRGKIVTAHRPADNDDSVPYEFPVAESKRASWDDALSRTASALQSSKGRIVLLTDAVTVGRSPTLTRVVADFSRAVGARVVSYSLIDDAPARAAMRAIYGRDQLPDYLIDQADFLISFGANFLDAWPSPVLAARRFGEFRQGKRRAQGEHGRFVFVGPRLSLTAAKADEWLPCALGTEALVAQGIGKLLADENADVSMEANASGLTAEQFKKTANGFRAAGARALAMGGDGLLGYADGAAQWTAVESLNAQFQSECVGFGESALAPPAPKLGGAGAGRRSLFLTPPNLGAGGAALPQIQSLVSEMNAGKIGAVLTIGQVNPAFTLPSSVGFVDALKAVPFIASLTPFEDETTLHADVLLPTRTFLEDWSDDVPAVLPAGTRTATLRQPVIDPQFIGGAGLSPADFAFTPWMDTRPVGDVLTDLARRVGKPLTDATMRDAVRRTWAGIGQADLTQTTLNNDSAWVNALSKGGFWTETTPTPARGKIVNSTLTPPAIPSADSFALLLYPHVFWTDGRHANLGWLQESPDPMTMAVWNSWVEINLQTAIKLGIRTGDVVRLTSPHGSLETFALPFPALHPSALAMPIGQGHALYGRVASGRGVNPLSILAPTAESSVGSHAFSATRVTLQKIADAKPGYDGVGKTLVLVQDRPGGQEPDAVKELIHTTAKEWKAAKPVTGPPKVQGSIFQRGQ